MNCLIICGKGENIISDKLTKLYTENLYEFLSDDYKISKLEKYKNIIISKEECLINKELYNLIDVDSITLVSTYLDFFIENYKNSSNCIDGELFITTYKTLEKLKKLDEEVKNDVSISLFDKYKLYLKLNKDKFSPLPLGLRGLIEIK